jgi:CheY-like chemotaxis protein
MPQPLRIVIADDDDISLVLYKKQLERLGHEVVCTASNGKELIERCAKELPDLIITDIKMPIMDGFEATLEIARRVTVPIILVSGFYKRDELKHVRYRHISGYMTKPFTEEELKDAINLAMSKMHDPRPPSQ